MIRNKFILAAILFVVASAVHAACVFASDDITQVDAVIGFETVYSGGRYTISQVAAIARDNGIGVLITADALLNHWRYGLWPLRNIIRKTEELKSILKYGAKRYFEDVSSVQMAYPGMVILGGIEAAPFYWWEGNPFLGNFAIRDWHKHIIIVGLESPSDISGIPAIGNAASLAKRSPVKRMLYIGLTLILISIGIFGLINGIRSERNVYERRYGLLLTQWLAIGIVLTVAGAAILLNGYPFADWKYDQYHGDRGAMPYQNMIDYVNSRGGLTFWAHPDARYAEKAGRITIDTERHSDYMLRTTGYTGFAIFYEGYEISGRPGAIWDDVLRGYCKGARSAPSWVIGTIDYDRVGSLDEQMRLIRTVLLVKSPGKAGALEAMRSGRMYVSKDSDASRFRLDRFTAGDASRSSEAFMGDEAVVSGHPVINISGHFTVPGTGPDRVKILLIKDGEPLKIFEKDAPFDIVYEDTDVLEPGRHYYRVELKSDKLFAVTNPVFVSKK